MYGVETGVNHVCVVIKQLLVRPFCEQMAETECCSHSNLNSSVATHSLGKYPRPHSLSIVPCPPSPGETDDNPVFSTFSYYPCWYQPGKCLREFKHVSLEEQTFTNTAIAKSGTVTGHYDSMSSIELYTKDCE